MGRLTMGGIRLAFVAVATVARTAVGNGGLARRLHVADDERWGMGKDIDMMVTRIGMTAALLGGVLLACVGCQNKLHDDNLALYHQNQELQSRLNEASAQPKADPGQITSLQSEIAQRDQRIKELESQLKQPTPGAGAQPGIEGIETTYDAAAGTMTVNLPGDVLFDAGSETLKSSAKATLDKIVAAVKRDYAAKPIRVEGHTDSDPISRTKNKWEDNLDLSLARAAAVSRFLITQGVPAKQITTSGFGATRPKGSKPKSRRVEIVVVTK